MTTSYGGQINDRNRGQRGRHQDREWNYISMRKLQRQPFPKMYEILRTTMIQFNWKLPGCVFSSTIQQPFSFQRGARPNPLCMCVGWYDKTFGQSTVNFSNEPLRNVSLSWEQWQLGRQRQEDHLGVGSQPQLQSEL